MDVCETKIKECIAHLEQEVLAILSDPKTDKAQKNIRMKPLTSKKQILENAVESMRMVDTVNSQEKE